MVRLSARLWAKLQMMVALIKVGDLGEIKTQLQRWTYSEATFFGLRRDLARPFDAPSAKVPLMVRQADAADLAALLDTGRPGLSGAGIYERMIRQRFGEFGIRTCYVAVTAEGRPCYMQYLIGPGENEKLQTHLHGVFPLLARDEALLEHAFTLEDFQGLGIMSSAMAQIAEKGTEIGARWVITFVKNDNIGSLKGCKRAGFEPYLVRRERWRLFWKSVTFEELPAGAGYPFEQAAAA